MSSMRCSTENDLIVRAGCSIAPSFEEGLGAANLVT
jgi:hypothetical protein